MVATDACGTQKHGVGRAIEREVEVGQWSTGGGIKAVYHRLIERVGVHHHHFFFAASHIHHPIAHHSSACTRIACGIVNKIGGVHAVENPFVDQIVVIHGLVGLSIGDGKSTDGAQECH